MDEILNFLSSPEQWCSSQTGTEASEEIKRQLRENYIKQIRFSKEKENSYERPFKGD